MAWYTKVHDIKNDT